MLKSKISATVESSGMARTIANDDASRRTAALLEELLIHSIRLRDLYKSARWQTADDQFRSLRILFEDHYKEQLRLVDVLLDRLRTLGGTRFALAGLLLQSTPRSQALRGRILPIQLLHGILEVHDAVLAAARSGANSDECADTAPGPDFVVGQIVLVNDTQFRSISDQLITRSDRRHLPVARQNGSNAHGEASPWSSDENAHAT